MNTVSLLEALGVWLGGSEGFPSIGIVTLPSKGILRRPADSSWIDALARLDCRTPLNEQENARESGSEQNLRVLLKIGRVTGGPSPRAAHPPKLGMTYSFIPSSTARQRRVPALDDKSTPWFIRSGRRGGMARDLESHE